MSNSLLKIENVGISFGKVQALKNVSLEIQAGEIHCLAGENGSGKSTLIKIISGVYKRDKGEVFFEGEKLDHITPIDSINRGIQVIYQDFSLFPNLTVAENLAINSEVASKKKLVNWKEIYKIAENAISRINPNINLDQKVENLSVAEKQMVAISRALMFNAKLIIMDEPTTALTRKEVKVLFDIILKLQKQGIAILFISHKLDEVFEISEKFSIIRNGELVFTGETTELDDKKFTYYMTGREFDDSKFEPKNISSNPVLEVKNLFLKNSYKDIGFKVHAGEILGITGLLDSGRSELALSLFGLLPATSGDIYIHGKKQKLNNAQDAMANKIGYVPEDRLSEGLFLPRSIADNLIISCIDELTNVGSILDKKKRTEVINNWVEKLEIKTDNPDNAASTLSGGNQQRIVLGKWLACNPDILILNGPTVGVDIGSKRDIHEILQNLAEQGMTIIIISDDLPEIIQNCSRIIVIKDGKIVLEDNSAELNEQKLLDAMM